MTTEQKIMMGAIAGSEMFNVVVRLNNGNEHNVKLVGAKTAFVSHIKEANMYPYNIIKLLARPVEDMSIDELDEWEPLLHHEWRDYDSEWYMEHTPDSERYLLSIGVLTKNLANQLPCKVEWISKD